MLPKHSEGVSLLPYSPLPAICALNFERYSAAADPGKTVSVLFGFAIWGCSLLALADLWVQSHPRPNLCACLQGYLKVSLSGLYFYQYLITVSLLGVSYKQCSLICLVQDFCCVVALKSSICFGSPFLFKCFSYFFLQTNTCTFKSFLCTEVLFPNVRNISLVKK